MSLDRPVPTESRDTNRLEFEFETISKASNDEQRTVELRVIISAILAHQSDAKIADSLRAALAVGTIRGVQLRVQEGNGRMRRRKRE